MEPRRYRDRVSALCGGDALADHRRPAVPAAPHDPSRAALRIPGQPAEAARAYLVWPLLGVLSLGALTAHAFRRQQEFLYGQAAYGDTGFACSLPLWPVYRALLLAGAVVVAGLVGIVAWGRSLGGTVVAASEGLRAATLTGMAVVMLAVVWLAGSIYTVRMSNLAWHHLRVGAHRFRSDLTIPSYLRLQLGNLLGMLLTLGLFRPWAVVRSARYRAARHVRAGRGTRRARGRSGRVAARGRRRGSRSVRARRRLLRGAGDLSCRPAADDHGATLRRQNVTGARGDAAP